jgi:site-specific DNA-methyltransferase (adenine-specific)
LEWIYSTGYPKCSTSLLKPAHEPIVLARKPFKGSCKANIEAHGTGGLNIDACRVPSPAGRYPANLVLDAGAGAVLDQQSGHSKSSDRVRSNTVSIGNGTTYNGGKAVVTGGYDDEGGASRFFPQADWEPALDGGPGFRYLAKAGKKERSAGVPGGATPHPTTKPVAVMAWLLNLLTPPGGTALDPFIGSGTTGVAAVREGFRFIGCELTADYLPRIEGRIRHAEATYAGEQLEL